MYNSKYDVIRRSFDNLNIVFGLSKTLMAVWDQIRIKYYWIQYIIERTVALSFLHENIFDTWSSCFVSCISSCLIYVRA